jgi:folate-binding protein YgfZ
MSDIFREHLKVREHEATTLWGDERESAPESARALSASVVAPVIDRGVLSVTGPDARRFLQAQLTGDVDAVGATHSGLNAYCNPQGRVIADFRVLRAGDGYLLSAPLDILSLLEERLTYFRLRSQVTFEMLSEARVTLGVSGPDAEQALAAAGLSLPGDIDAVADHSETLVVRVPGERTRVEILTAVERAPGIWDALRRHAEPVGPDAWRLLDVQAGIPWIVDATTEAFVPQMLNLHALGGISFTKGCFPGQEIIARLRYRGSLKRRMYRATTPSERRPLPGASIEVDGASGTIGKVVTTAAAPDGGYDLLAVMTIDRAESDGATLRLESNDAELTLAPLPYDVELAYDPDA